MLRTQQLLAEIEAEKMVGKAEVLAECRMITTSRAEDARRCAADAIGAGRWLFVCVIGWPCSKTDGDNAHLQERSY